MSGKIPTALVLAAREYGCNNLKYMGTLDGFSIYCQKYAERLPIPTGMPNLFLWNGTEVKYICSIESLDILEKLARRTVPAAVKKAAKGRKHLGGTLEMVARYNNKDVYTYTYAVPMTTGMPELYMWDGVSVEVIGGEEALRILNADNTKTYTDLTENGAGLFDLRILACYNETTRGASITNALKKYHLTAKQYKDNKKRVLDSLKV